MADQNPQHSRRQHFHRGRRGPDRRGSDRRGPVGQSAEQGGREHREHVDVEQIMREIRSRISQRHGIELTTQQIQELAARRLEAILDPRTVKPSLLEQIRRSASTPIDSPPPPELSYSFEDTTLYDSHRGALRFIRRLLNPILKLFFNPNPLIAALNTQARLNQAAAQREVERERRQAEWNALHYDILQRLVLEVARTSLETQQLAMRVEALSAKVDFAERRARSIEGALHQVRPGARHEPAPQPTHAAQTPPREPAAQDVASAPAGQEGAPVEGGRRRRRRRRGRRPQGLPADGTSLGVAAGAAAADSRLPDEGEASDVDEGDEEENGVDTGDESELFEAASPAESVPVESEPAPSAFEPHEPAAASAAVAPPAEPSESTTDANPEPAPDAPEPPRPSEPVGD